MRADDASEFVDDLRVPTAVRSPDVKVDGYHHTAAKRALSATGAGTPA